MAHFSVEKPAQFRVETNTTRQDPILGAIASQTAAAVVLTEKLAVLDRRMNDMVWLDAIDVIEQHLMFAYEANRSVFAAEPGRGLDCIIRPTIEQKLFANRIHGTAMLEWLRTHGHKFDASLTRDLKAAASRLFEEGGGFPTDAGSSGPLDSALKNRVRSIDPEAADLLSGILATVGMHQADRATLPVIRMIQSVAVGLEEVADFKRPSVRQEFLALVFQLARFLELKLDGSREQDTHAAYLFNHDPLPVEKDLQQDFLRFGKSVGLPVDDEVKGIAGGRADIRYESKPHRMIIEVKRELSDSSFENLLRSYGDQTAIYQTTNVKLGVMLVLDLARPHLVLAHMDTFYETRTGDLLRDGTHRGVVIVKIPGRRGTPSAATVAAKAAKPKKPRSKRAAPKSKMNRAP